ncbi:hypothetical protein KW796_00645 [Candidatus Parcubacteria bacterium]|nr:hypothetical protein [Candidatus Parcubacteria bacterium]
MDTPTKLFLGIVAFVIAVNLVEWVVQKVLKAKRAEAFVGLFMTEEVVMGKLARLAAELDSIFREQIRVQSEGLDLGVEVWEDMNRRMQDIICKNKAEFWQAVELARTFGFLKENPIASYRDALKPQKKDSST